MATDVVCPRPRSPAGPTVPHPHAPTTPGRIIDLPQPARVELVGKRDDGGAGLARPLQLAVGRLPAPSAEDELCRGCRHACRFQLRKRHLQCPFRGPQPSHHPYRADRPHTGPPTPTPAIPGSTGPEPFPALPLLARSLSSTVSLQAARPYAAATSGRLHSLSPMRYFAVNSPHQISHTATSPADRSPSCTLGTMSRDRSELPRRPHPTPACVMPKWCSIHVAVPLPHSYTELCPARLPAGCGSPRSAFSIPRR